MSVNWTELRRDLLGEYQADVPPPKIKLPMLPTAVLEFSRKAEDPTATAAELGRIIETDSGLTAELLRYVNSAATGLRTKASTAQQAIVFLGLRLVTLYLLTAGVQRAMKSCRSKLINLQVFWHANLERALFARQVAELLKADGDLAFAGSMLHDFMLPALANERFNDYLRFTRLQESQRRPLVDFERSTFGWDHCSATAQILLAWQFPDELVCATLLHHGGLTVLKDEELGATAVAAIAVAALVPDVLRQSPNGLQQLQQLEAIWPGFDLHAMAAAAADQLIAISPTAREHATLLRRLEKLGALASAT